MSSEPNGQAPLDETDRAFNAAAKNVELVARIAYLEERLKVMRALVTTLTMTVSDIHSSSCSTMNAVREFMEAEIASRTPR